MEQSVLTNIDNNISRTNTEQLHNQKKNSLSHALANFTLSSTSIDVRVTPVHSPIQVLLVFIYYLFLFFNFVLTLELWQTHWLAVIYKFHCIFIDNWNSFDPICSLGRRRPLSRVLTTGPPCAARREVPLLRLSYLASSGRYQPGSRLRPVHTDTRAPA